MIESFTIPNAGPIREFSPPSPTPVNLIIGQTGSGKSFLLKLLYAALRSTETWHQKNGWQSISDLIAAKLQRVLLTKDLGSLVTRDSEQDLAFSFKTDHAPPGICHSPECNRLRKRGSSFSFPPVLTLPLKNCWFPPSESPNP